jgi:hypothetical protein
MLLALCLFLMPFNRMVRQHFRYRLPRLTGTLFDFRPLLWSKAGELALLESGGLLSEGNVGQKCAIQDKS